MKRRMAAIPVADVVAYSSLKEAGIASLSCHAHEPWLFANTS